MTEPKYRRQTLDKGPRGESKVCGGVFQGTPAGSRFQHQGRGREKTKEPHSVTVYKQVNHGRLQWGHGSALGDVFTGEGGRGTCEWEGIFLWRNTHRPKMVDK